MVTSPDHPCFHLFIILGGTRPAQDVDCRRESMWMKSGLGGGGGVFCHRWRYHGRRSQRLRRRRWDGCSHGGGLLQGGLDLFGGHILRGAVIRRLVVIILLRFLGRLGLLRRFAFPVRVAWLIIRLPASKKGLGLDLQ